ncbi:MAG: adenylate/guanylate cyclase domain-containing protein [Verrucomicrobiota bacterium]|nr:adenylate/guanylate cyclase domain-containing protein [Verrucomicrobiota bacterium]
MSRKRLLAVSGIALLCLIAIAALDLLEPFFYVRTRNLLRDTITRAGRTTPPNDDLVFLAIDSDSVSLEEDADIAELYGLTDENSIEMRGLRLMSKLWPWPRELYGLVLERLVTAGAKVVMFDLTFPTPTAGDEPFHLALEKYGPHAVIGSNFVSAASRSFTTISASHTRPPDSLVPQTRPMDDRVAYTNFWPDEDDVVRRAQFRITFEQVQGVPLSPDSEEFLSLGARALMKAGMGDLIPRGLDDHLFRYTAPPRAGFRPRSLFEIFVPEYWKHNYQDGEFFRGKIVVVGAEGNWQHDEHPTPFGSMPGPELHLNAINAAIHGEFIHEWSHGTVFAVTLCAGVLAVMMSLLIRSPWLRLAALVAANCTLVWLALQAFNHFSAYVPSLAPLLQINVTVLFGLVCDFTWERVEKNRVRRTLEKYVSKNIVRELLDRPKAYAEALGGVIKPATILFSDIRGYSSVTASSDPQALVAQLNEYLTAMVDCVFRFGGTLDKFIGDAVMAVWGNAHSEGVRTDAINAVRAGLAMRAELARLNGSWRARGLPELRIGMAINHGEVVVGNIGSPQRMEFTVIGDAVNVSWKLQELTKEYGSEIIVGENVMSLVVEEFELRPLGQAQIRGVPDPINIFAVSGAVELDEADIVATRAS